MMTFGANIENPAAYEAAIKRNIIRNARQTFNQWAGHVSVWLLDNENRNEFCRKLCESLDQYGKLSEKQVQCVEQMMVDDWYRERAKEERKAARYAEDLQKGHVGTVGKRRDFALTVQHIHTFQRPGFGYGARMELVYIYIMRDAAGNIVVYKGTKDIGAYSNGDCGYWITAKAGSHIVMKATVKEQGIRDGIAQTIVNRPKINSMALEEKEI